MIDIQTGEWRGVLSGVGAGLDSFFEYLLKTYILFGEETELQMFLESQRYSLDYMRRGRSLCRGGIFRNFCQNNFQMTETHHFL